MLFFNFRSIKELDELLSKTLGVYFSLTTLTLCTIAIRITSVSVYILIVNVYSLINHYLVTIC